MRRRRPRFRRTRFLPIREKRIRIPQPKDRPLQLHQASLVKREEARPAADHFVLHRRGLRKTQVGMDPLEARAVSESVIKGTLPERILWRSLLFPFRLKPEVDFSFQCLAGHHRVLTDGLRWIPISQLKKGDGLIAFSEDGGPRGPDGRKYERAIVISNEPDIERTFKITLKSGAEIICTPEHPWLAFGDPRGGVHGQFVKGATQTWVQAKKLRPGIEIPKLLPTWEAQDTRHAGYLAGFFDGEGSVIQTHQHRDRNLPEDQRSYYISLTAAQNHGPILQHFIRSVDIAGFDFSIYDYKDKYERSYDNGMRKVVHLRIRGGRSEALRFLGTIRPEKMKQLDPTKLGAVTKIEADSIISVEEAGRQEIYRLATSTRTYIAEGYGMHNSSLDGGRLSLGGIVADFLFPFIMLVFQVQGPTHDQHLRKRKDTEQRLVLEAMGYRVIDFELEEIFDAARLDSKLRRIFGYAGGQSSASATHEREDAEEISPEDDLIAQMFADVYAMQEMVGYA